MFKTVVAYILAFIILGWIAGLISAVFLPVVVASMKSKIAPIICGIGCSVSVFLAFLIFRFICGLMGVQLVYAMIVLPVILTISNDRNRIKVANLAIAQRESRNEEGKVPKTALRDMEYGYFVGDIIGFAVALVLVSPLPLY